MIAIYSRQSIDKKDSISIETQIQHCEQEIGGEETKVYYDKGYSGSNMNRPAFESMIADIKSNLITKVVVYKLDRISRSLLDFAQIINIFNQHKVEFVSCNEKFDTSTPIGKAMLSIVMVFAQLERETIQARIKDNYYARGKQGFYLSGPAPYGFKKVQTRYLDKKTYTYEPVAEQVEVIQWVFETYAQPGWSLGKISALLNEQNVKTQTGVNWDSSKISRMLSNPVYVRANADVYSYFKSKGYVISNDVEDFIGEKGCFWYGKREASSRKYTDISNQTISIALHDGIIDSSLFLKCQFKLSENQQIKNTGKGKYTWLSGLLKCGYCGASMRVQQENLRCTGKDVRHDCDGFQNRLAKKKDVEYYVQEELFKEIDKKRELGYQKKQIDSHNVQKENEYKIRINKIDEQIKNLLNNLAEGNTTLITYINNKIEELDKEKQELERERIRLTVIKSSDSEIFKIIAFIDDWDTFDMAQKQQFAAHFIKYVEITEDSISITWTDKFLLI